MTMYGSNADQLAAHGMLGRQAYVDEAIIKSQEGNPTEVGQVIFELTDNTTLVVKAMGTDRVIRTVTLTLT